MAREMIRADLLNSHKTRSGKTMGELSGEGPVLLVFLLHFGRTFCREAAAENGKIRSDIEAKGTRLAFVHLASDDDKAQKFFSPYGFQDLPRFAVPVFRSSSR